MPKFLIVSLAVLLSSASAFAACQTYVDSNGDMTTFCPEATYQTYVDRNGDSMTFGSDGTSSQTYVDSDRRGAITFGDPTPVPPVTEPRSHIDPYTGKWRD